MKEFIAEKIFQGMEMIEDGCRRAQEDGECYKTCPFFSTCIDHCPPFTWGTREQPKRGHIGRCFNCGAPVYWSADFTLEDFGEDGDGLVQLSTCSKCGAEYQMTLRELQEIEK